MKKNYQKKNIYNNLDSKNFLLYLLKALYVVASLTIYKQPSISKLSQLDPELFFPPPGPFQLFSGFPDTSSIVAIENLIMLLLIIYIFLPLKNLFIPLIICSLKVLISGLSYSLGHISHDLLYLVFPLIIYFSYKDIINKNYRYYKILSTFLGLYFLQSGLSKLFSFWLALESSSVVDWLLYYKYFYNVISPTAELIIGLPIFGELLDWITVLTEIIVGLLFLTKKLSVIKYLIPFLIVFNYSILLVFRIDFSKNYFLYLILLIFLLENESRKFIKFTSIYFVILIFYIFLESNFEIKYVNYINSIFKISDYREFISLYFFAGYLLLLIFKKLKIDEINNLNVKKNYFKYYLLLLLWIPIPFGYEPYPSLTGPHFLGTNGYYPTKLTMYVDGLEVIPSEYFPLDNVHLMKLLSFLQPESTSYLGHSTLNRRLYLTEINEYLVKNNIKIIWEP